MSIIHICIQFFLIEKNTHLMLVNVFSIVCDELRGNEFAEILHCCGNLNPVMNLDIRLIIRILIFG